MKFKILTVMLFCAFVSQAQKFKLIEGNVKNLSEITTYNLVFDYENLKVDKFDTEEAFLQDKMKKREEKGTDEDFKNSWFSDRETRYAPKFIESFNKRFDDQEVAVSQNNTDAKYTILVKTHWIYPGYNVGVMRSPAKINTDITVYENSDPSTILYKASIEKVQGNGAAGFDYNSGYRISEAYALLAKKFAGDVVKKARK